MSRKLTGGDPLCYQHREFNIKFYVKGKGRANQSVSGHAAMRVWPRGRVLYDVKRKRGQPLACVKAFGRAEMQETD